MQTHFSGTNTLRNVQEDRHTMQMHKLELQERLIISKLPEIVIDLQHRLDQLDNDISETIELQVGEIQIYVDANTRGWDYRSIELIAVDIMNSECDALTRSAQQLYNILSETVQQLNQQMDDLYANWN